ncbi:MAG: hypothetical protein A2341_06810 [Deltaproteobacteria bacterium RIFOXYB12_FULL_58_9]|nr:MAG: hypothetical protein A2341_06810 [Deltaproteobacteria bacterium RIFOXYB12_FULL_58_9]
MSHRRVQLVILCEDTQQEAFIRRFLSKAGWNTRRFRVEKAPSGRGSGEQFVKERFPLELDSYRRKSAHVGSAVVVMIDGDNRGVATRQKELDDACTEKNVQQRQSKERVAVFVPTWNIETWFAYLDGQTVDETQSNYPRLDRERLCQEHVNTLFGMCESGSLREPSPASLRPSRHVTVPIRRCSASKGSSHNNAGVW